MCIILPVYLFDLNVLCLTVWFSLIDGFILYYTYLYGMLVVLILIIVDG